MRGVMRGLTGRPVRRRWSLYSAGCVALLVAGLSVGTTGASALASDTLVTLSGVVSEASGAPSPDTNVSFGGVSTVTDASGAYVLHPFAGTTAFLNVSGSGLHTEYGPDDGLFTIAADAVVNFVWPAPAQARITVVDTTSTPLAGVEVHKSGSTERRSHCRTGWRPPSTETLLPVPHARRITRVSARSRR